MKLIGFYIFTVLSIVLVAFGSSTFAGEQGGTSQETHGDQSPAINDANVVTVIYKGLSKEERELLFKQLGSSQQLIERLSKELEASKKEKEQYRAEIQTWADKYEKLRNKISQMPENSEQASKAKAALVEGDLKKAESIAANRAGAGTANRAGAGTANITGAPKKSP